MNERIRQLAEQAKEYAENIQNDPLKIYTLECFNEKFAQLIVAECADYANWYQANSPYTDIAKAIKEHFGVEE